jgi:3-dehydroquinate synthase
MEQVHVALGNRSYDVVIDAGWLDQLGPSLSDRKLARKNIAVFTSPVVGEHYYVPVQQTLSAAGVSTVGRHDIPDGEDSKSLDNFARAVQWLARFAPDPSVEPVVVALGGGVVGDLAGFAAASFRRGVPYVQVPTTLLAAVDSSVGGKTAVNLPEGKNLVGAFYQPRLVFVDLSTLRTLPEREIRCGMAEVIKYGAILDADLFAFLEDSVEDLMALDMEALLRVVPRCVELKAEVVKEDEHDRKGVRVCLNFGHTLGHAIEKAAAGRLNHGEAVSVGMAAAAHMSVRLGQCPYKVQERVEGLLTTAGLPTRIEKIDVDDILEFTKHDKKFVAGRNRYVLLSSIGQWSVREDVADEVVDEAVRYVLS